MYELFIVFCAKYLIAVVLLGAAAVVALQSRERGVRLGLLVFGALPVTWALARLCGLFLQHEQPFAVGGYEPLIPHEVDNSFPSDHTALAATLATALGFANRWVGLLFLFLALLIGSARIYAGLHYPIDISVGLVVGALAVLIMRVVLSFIPRSVH